jgi:hypothetical protein
VLGNSRIALPDDAGAREDGPDLFHLSGREVVDRLDLAQELGIVLCQC